MTRRALLAAMPALAWPRQAPEFPNWPDDYADRILTGSPWAKQVTVSYRTQAPGAPPVRAEMYLTIRWASALPVRQALALSEFGRERLDEPGAREILSRGATEYVVEIAGVPATLPGGAAQIERALRKTASLSVKGRMLVKAAEVAVPEHGMHLLATLRFPRFENLSGDEGAIRFYGEPGAMRIDEQFKLKEMTYRGRLEL
jgi:hypothetical protein